MTKIDMADKPERYKKAINLVFEELNFALEAYPLFHSVHETLGVMEEERHELKEAIHKNDDANIREELAQIAAVAIKGLISMPDEGAKAQN